MGWQALQVMQPSGLVVERKFDDKGRFDCGGAARGNIDRTGIGDVRGIA
jgi:hypothetical protein